MTPPSSSSSTRETRREAQALREELASTRIAMAKQAASVKSLKEEVTHLRTRETDLVQKVRHLEEQLAESREVAATAHQKNAELEARAQAIPQLMEMLTEFRTIQGEIQQTLSTLTQVADELTWNQVQQAKRRTTPRQTARPPSSLTVEVKAGDTLWGIARAHGLSVPELKRANGLTSDLIHVGQTLTIPGAPRPEGAHVQATTEDGHEPPNP